METSKLTIYYDGMCPLCSKEIEHYREKDTQGLLLFIDISAADFDEKLHGLEGVDYFKYFHVKSKDGVFITGVDAFAAIWQELDCFKPLQYLANNKLAKPFMDIGYNLFAHFRPLLRKKDCKEDVCQR